MSGLDEFLSPSLAEMLVRFDVEEIMTAPTVADVTRALTLALLYTREQERYDEHTLRVVAAARARRVELDDNLAAFLEMAGLGPARSAS